MPHLKAKFGRRLRELRDAEGWSREEFSGKVGLSVRRIATIELGTGWPRAETVEAIAKVFNIEVRELFDFSALRFLPQRSL